MNRKQFLTGEWQFKELGSNQWLTAQVPGCVQLDLIEAGELNNPFYRNNESEFYKLEDKNWIYKKTFTVDKNIAEYSKINLVFAGIDTIAEIYLNDQLLGKTNNMFIEYSFDVKENLIKGDNELKVKFVSAKKNSQTIKDNDAVKIDATNDTVRNYIRKAQYSFGWDWGPTLVQTGLWRPVYLEYLTKAKLKDLYVATSSITDQEAILEVSGKLNLFSEEEVEVELVTEFEGKEISKTKVDLYPEEKGKQIKAKLKIDNPKLWYPQGRGNQPLYDIIFIVWQKDKIITEEKVRTGIRTVNLLQEQDDIGESFILEVNGERIFAKGANWIPGDSFLPRMTKEKYEEYLDLAVEANMNILRVWGGGIYENKEFYQACDERGILVWQDFMYACAEYPDQLDWFRKQAKKEAIEVVKKLRNHPSIVLWCGNNEVNWIFGQQKGKDEVAGNKIFKQVLPQVCSEYDPFRPYWVSSPYSKTEEPNSMKEGNRHNWNVWSRWQDYTAYQEDTSRFISEFGFQAMPNWETVKSYTKLEDRHILNPIVLGHNKMVEGQERLIRYLVRHLGFPKDFKSFVYLTQFNQAEAVKTAVEHWRSRKYKTAGAIYWQFNDCWPVASWSSVDYYGRKKGLYHYTKQFYAPILPIIKQKDDEIVINVDNDLMRNVEAEITVSAYSLAGDLKAIKEYSSILTKGQVEQTKKFNLSDLSIGYQPQITVVDNQSTTLQQEVNGELLDTVIYVTVEVGGQEYSNYKTFAKFRELDLAQPNFELETNNNKLRLKVDKPAFGVFIVGVDKELGLADNCLNLIPNQEYEIEIEKKVDNIDIYDLTTMVQKIY
ncbi:glycoside hydrolase family 2 protein [Halanaerocella petrolearia]